MTGKDADVSMHSQTRPSWLEAMSTGVPLPVESEVLSLGAPLTMESEPGVPVTVEPETISVALPTWVHGEWSGAGLAGQQALRVDSVTAVVSEASESKRISGVMSIAGLPVDAIRMLPDLEQGSEPRA